MKYDGITHTYMSFWLTPFNETLQGSVGLFRFTIRLVLTDESHCSEL